MSVKAVIFDCDGVLVDSKKANVAYYNHMAETFGRHKLHKSEEDFIHHSSVFEALKLIFGNNEKLLSDIMAYRRKIGYEPFIKYLEPSEGIYDCLKTLKGKYHLAVWTNRSETIGPLLRELDMARYFEKVMSCIDVQNTKPHPEGAVTILNYFKCQAHQAVYIGDSIVDEQGSKAAGMRFVAYKNPDLIAEKYINDFMDLPPLVASMNNSNTK